jgi:hypothetical protein
MKRFFFALIAVVVLSGNIGCARLNPQGCREGCNGNCSVCGMSVFGANRMGAKGMGAKGMGANRMGAKGMGANRMTAYGEACDPNTAGRFANCQIHQNPRAYVGPAGPPTAAVTYPYYTTRGPRDFFLADPLTIGP